MALEKALITDFLSGERITAVLFNPEEYTLSKEINYARAGVLGLTSPITQFVHGNAETLDMDLFLDTYEDRPPRDVRDLVKRITDLMAVKPSLHAPPPVVFTWGSLAFVGVLVKASQRYVMFRPDGVPVRARLQVSFHEYKNVALEAKEVKRETADYSKFHRVVQGETLSGIAGTVFEDPRLWRAIAVHNQIDDPRQLYAGQQLLIPQLPYTDPQTGAVMR
jgi:nucleoid-associated protein YgaU